MPTTKPITDQELVNEMREIRRLLEELLVVRKDQLALARKAAKATKTAVKR